MGIVHLGQELLSDYWNDIFQLLIKHSSANNCGVRQAVLFGLGEFAKFTKTDYQNYGPATIDALSKAYKIKRIDGDKKEDFASARDNAAASIGKIIKYQGEKVNVKELAEKWVHCLPIEEDKSE